MGRRDHRQPRHVFTNQRVVTKVMCTHIASKIGTCINMPPPPNSFFRHCVNCKANLENAQIIAYSTHCTTWHRITLCLPTLHIFFISRNNPNSQTFVILFVNTSTNFTLLVNPLENLFCFGICKPNQLLWPFRKKKSSLHVHGWSTLWFARFLKGLVSCHCVHLPYIAQSSQAMA